MNLDFKKLANARDLDNGVVTYHFADNTKLVAPINSGIFKDERGRRRNLNQVAQIFKDTAWDLKAIAVEI